MEERVRGEEVLNVRRKAISCSKSQLTESFSNPTISRSKLSSPSPLTLSPRFAAGRGSRHRACARGHRRALSDAPHLPLDGFALPGKSEGHAGVVLTKRPSLLQFAVAPRIRRVQGADSRKQFRSSGPRREWSA